MGSSRPTRSWFPQRQRWRLFGGKPRHVWTEQYAASHAHPLNKACHLLGIPLITASLPLAVLAWWWPAWWMLPAGLFVAGWLLQFIGHAVEGKPPEFLRDWRFLLVGFSWWLAQIKKCVPGSHNP